jgi:hypothetical protein
MATVTTFYSYIIQYKYSNSKIPGIIIKLVFFLKLQSYIISSNLSKYTPTIKMVTFARRERFRLDGALRGMCITGNYTARVQTLRNTQNVCALQQAITYDEQCYIFLVRN